MIGLIVGLVIVGLVAGALGRLVVPGPDPMGLGMTILLGLGGSFIGGFVGRLLFGAGGGRHWILSVIGAAALVLVYRNVGRRRRAY